MIINKFINIDNILVALTINISTISNHIIAKFWLIFRNFDFILFFVWKMKNDFIYTCVCDKNKSHMLTFPFSVLQTHSNIYLLTKVLIIISKIYIVIIISCYISIFWGTDHACSQFYLLLFSLSLSRISHWITPRISFWKARVYYHYRALSNYAMPILCLTFFIGLANRKTIMAWSFISKPTN